MKEFWLCFVPLFVAVDATGVLPLFIHFTQDMDPHHRGTVLRQSIITAIGVAMVFLILGKAILNLLGITVADFMVAGGVLLVVLSISDLLSMEKTQRIVDSDGVGVVPLGVPLIAGPAVLTTCLLLMNEYGIALTAAALVLNIIIAGIVFRLAEYILRFLGRAGTKAISKVANLLLAAIGVMIVRKGIMLFLGSS